MRWQRDCRNTLEGYNIYNRRVGTAWGSAGLGLKGFGFGFQGLDI